MDVDHSYMVDAAAHMLYYWNPADKKKLTVKSAMNNVGFGADAIEKQSIQVRVRRRLKELQALQGLDRGLTNVGGCPMEVSVGIDHQSTPSTLTDSYGSRKKKCLEDRSTHIDGCNADEEAKDNSGTDIGTTVIADLTEKLSNEASSKTVKEKKTRCTPHQRQTAWAKSNLERQKDNNAHKECTRLWARSKELGPKDIDYRSSKSIVDEVNQKYGTSGTRIIPMADSDY